MKVQVINGLNLKKSWNVLMITQVDMIEISHQFALELGIKKTHPP